MQYRVTDYFFFPAPFLVAPLGGYRLVSFVDPILFGPARLLVLLVVSCDGPVCVSVLALVFRFTGMIGRISLSSESDPLFLNRRPVVFRCCLLALAFFKAHSFTSCGVGGAK